MRDDVLDNLKFFLISLVVVGHVIEPLKGKIELAKSLYIFIYLFHIPMFAYVSGIVSSRKMNDKVIRKLISNLVIPYIFLEISYSIFDFYIASRGSLVISPLIPYWILWFLFSLIIWRILLPVFDQFKFPVLLALIAGLAVGLNGYGYNLSFSRTFTFFPFFLLGHYYHEAIIRKIETISSANFIGGSLLLIVLSCIILIPETNNINVRWLYGSYPYASLGVDWETGTLYKLAIYASAIIVGMALLVVTPKTKNILTEYGKYSLYVYVLHGFAMKGLLAIGLYQFIDNEYKLVLLIFSSLLLLPLLTFPIIRLVADNLMTPFVSIRKMNIVNLVLSKRR